MKKVIGLLIIVLIVTVFFADMLTEKEEYRDLFLFEIVSEHSSEEIVGWRNEENDYFVFLPSYAELCDVKLKKNGGLDVWIDGILINEETGCADFLINTPYSLTYSIGKIEYHQQIMFLQSENIPAMYIDVDSGNMDYIHAKKGNNEAASIRVYEIDGKINFDGNITSIRGRGNNTWEGFEKKPYSISLSESRDLLGMGVAEEWILLANADDFSHVRNKIVFDFAADVGLPYSPKSQWVDLYLNNEYVGLYLLTEKNEVHSERVNVLEENAWLLSLEVEERLIEQKIPYIKTKSGQALRIHDPEKTSDIQRQILENKWNEIETLILEPEATDKEDLWNVIDLDSWVKKYLIEELFCGPDSCLISQYFYFDQDRVFAGPVWDYDHTMGAKQYWQLQYPNSLYGNRLYAYDSDESPWFNALYHNEVFYERVIEVFESEYLASLENLIQERIVAYTEHIRASASMNQLRWDLERGVEEESKHITNFMESRIAFLKDLWIDQESYCHVQINPGNGEFYAHVYVKAGEGLMNMPNIEDVDNGWYGEFLGWFYSGTNTLFDETQPIDKDIQIEGRWGRTEPFSYNKLLLYVAIFVIVDIAVGLTIVDIYRSMKGRLCT